MAKTKNSASAETKETSKRTGAKSQTWLHEAMIEWLEETLEIDMSKMSAVEVLSVAFARHIDWRKTDRYREVKEAHKAERDAADADRKAASAERRAAAKEAEEVEAPKEAKATKAPAKTKTAKGKKAAPAIKTPAGRKNVKSKTSSETENPFT